MFCNQTQNLLFKNFIFPKTNVRKCKNSPFRPPPTKKSPVKFQYSSFRLRPTNRCLLQLGKYKGEGNVLLFYLNVRPFLQFDHFKVSQSSTFIKLYLLKVKVMIKKTHSKRNFQICLNTNSQSWALVGIQVRFDWTDRGAQWSNAAFLKLGVATLFRVAKF